MSCTAELDPEAASPRHDRAPSGVEELVRFATHDAFETLRGAAREPRVARHFHRLDPFGAVTAREEFGRALLGLALWLAPTLGRSTATALSTAAAARLAGRQSASAWTAALEKERERYGELDYRYALERFSRHAVELLALDEEDRWAAQMLLVRTLGQPLRERVERLNAAWPRGGAPGLELAQPA
ncbi:MAG: hypothetical protein ABR599_02945 [Gemmatimonadota bacterium]